MEKRFLIRNEYLSRTLGADMISWTLDVKTELKPMLLGPTTIEYYNAWLRGA